METRQMDRQTKWWGQFAFTPLVDLFLVSLIYDKILSMVVSYYSMCNMFLSELPSFLAAMMFAVHPIHTEAVRYHTVTYNVTC